MAVASGVLAARGFSAARRRPSARGQAPQFGALRCAAGRATINAADNDGHGEHDAFYCFESRVTALPGGKLESLWGLKRGTNSTISSAKSPTAWHPSTIRIRARAPEDPGTAGDEGEGNWAALLRQ